MAPSAHPCLVNCPSEGEEACAQVSSLHDCRHPNVVLMLGAWLGQDQVFMVQELLQTDLRKALNDPGRQEELRWDNRCPAPLAPSPEQQIMSGWQGSLRGHDS